MRWSKCVVQLAIGTLLSRCFSTLLSILSTLSTYIMKKSKLTLRQRFNFLYFEVFMLMVAFFGRLQVPDQFHGVIESFCGSIEELRALNEKLLPCLQQLERITEVYFLFLAWLHKSEKLK